MNFSDINYFGTSVSFLSAFSGGILSFFSPCVMPLIPVFLSVLVVDYSNIKHVIKRTVGFFSGLSVFFALIGLMSGFFGSLLIEYQKITNILMGLIVIILGFFYILKINFIKAKKFNLMKWRNDSFFSSFILGIIISVVWIPCSGPVLGSILAMAANTGTAVRGSLLLFVYSLGISFPFIFLSGFVSKIISKITFGEPKWQKFLRYTGGILLIITGILISTGFFNSLQGGF